MPANLTPDYLKAEQWFRQASTTEEKILALEEMMRVIPKHKGTNHMRAELRKKYSALKESAEKRKKASHGPDPFHIPKSGSGQVVLLGLPNSGKSSIVSALTHAKTEVADFPFTTSIPTPGMAKFEDVHIEIVDMPPITADFAPSGIVNTLRNCDLIAIVIDLSGNIEQQLQTCLNFLDAHHLLLDQTPPAKDMTGSVLARKAFIIAAKSDIAPADAAEKLKAFCKKPLGIVVASVKTRQGLDELLAKVFSLLDIVRIYAKKPGHEPDMTEPFVLPKGSTVMDLARSIHRDLAEKLKSARCWTSASSVRQAHGPSLSRAVESGSKIHNGQNVHRTHILCDKDIIELHFA
jgi:ribosome-interacting GTPase 1